MVVRFSFDQQLESYHLASTLYADLICGIIMVVGSIVCIFVQKRYLLRMFLGLAFASHGAFRIVTAFSFAFSNSSAHVDESYFWFAAGLTGLVRGVVCWRYEQYFILSIPYLFMSYMIALCLHNYYVITPALASKASNWIPATQFVLIIGWALARLLRRWNLNKSVSAIQPHLLLFNSIWAQLQSDEVARAAIKHLEQVCGAMRNPYHYYSQTSRLESCWHTLESCLGRRPVSTQVSQVTLAHSRTSELAHSANLVGQEQCLNVAGAHEPKSNTAGLMSLDMLYTQALLMHAQLLVAISQKSACCSMYYKKRNV